MEQEKEKSSLGLGSLQTHDLTLIGGSSSRAPPGGSVSNSNSKILRRRGRDNKPIWPNQVENVGGTTRGQPVKKKKKNSRRPVTKKEGFGDTLHSRLALEEEISANLRAIGKLLPADFAGTWMLNHLLKNLEDYRTRAELCRLVREKVEEKQTAMKLAKEQRKLAFDKKCIFTSTANERRTASMLLAEMNRSVLLRDIVEEVYFTSFKEYAESGVGSIPRPARLKENGDGKQQQQQLAPQPQPDAGNHQRSNAVDRSAGAILNPATESDGDDDLSSIGTISTLGTASFSSPSHFLRSRRKSGSKRRGRAGHLPPVTERGRGGSINVSGTSSVISTLSTSTRGAELAENWSDAPVSLHLSGHLAKGIKSSSSSGSVRGSDETVGSSSVGTELNSTRARMVFAQTQQLLEDMQSPARSQAVARKKGSRGRKNQAAIYKRTQCGLHGHTGGSGPDVSCLRPRRRLPRQGQADLHGRLREAFASLQPPFPVRIDLELDVQNAVIQRNVEGAAAIVHPWEVLADLVVSMKALELCDRYIREVEEEVGEQLARVNFLPEVLFDALVFTECFRPPAAQQICTEWLEVLQREVKAAVLRTSKHISSAQHVGRPTKVFLEMITNESK